MSVESLVSKAVYQGNGATTVFPVPFSYSRPEHVHVLLTRENGAREMVTDFFLEQTEAGNSSVHYPMTGAPITPGERLTIYRQTPRTQILDLIYGGAFSPETLENDGFDRLCMMVQELGEELERSLHLPIDTTDDSSLDAVFARLAQYQKDCLAVAEQCQAILDNAGNRADEALQTVTTDLQAAREEISQTLDAKQAEITGQTSQIISEHEARFETARQEAEASMQGSLEAAQAAAAAASESAEKAEQATNVGAALDLLGGMRQCVRPPANVTYTLNDQDRCLLLAGNVRILLPTGNMTAGAVWLLHVYSGTPALYGQDRSGAEVKLQNLQTNYTYFLINTTGSSGYRLCMLPGSAYNLVSYVSS